MEDEKNDLLLEGALWDVSKLRRLFVTALKKNDERYRSNLQLRAALEHTKLQYAEAYRRECLNMKVMLWFIVMLLHVDLQEFGYFFWY